MVAAVKHAAAEKARALASHRAVLDVIPDRLVSLCFEFLSLCANPDGEGSKAGPAWRWVRPHFKAMLGEAVFPVLRLAPGDREKLSVNVSIPRCASSDPRTVARKWMPE